jgi:hypothetical protein
MSEGHAEGGGGGGGSNILGKIGDKISGGAKNLGKKAYGKFNQWATPEAQEQPSVLGNVAEAGMDIYRGTVDNVGRQLTKGGNEVLDSARAVAQGYANVLHPKILRVDQITVNTGKAILGTVNEGVHLSKEVAARPLAALETGLLEGANMVDHIVHGTRKLLGKIPVIGGILGLGITAPFTIGAKVARLPVKGLGKIGGWINEKLDAGTNKVRNFAIGESGGHKEAPAANNVVDFAAEKAKRQKGHGGHAASGDAHAAAAHG